MEKLHFIQNIQTSPLHCFLLYNNYNFNHNQRQGIDIIIALLQCHCFSENRNGYKYIKRNHSETHFGGLKSCSLSLSIRKEQKQQSKAKISFSVKCKDLSYHWSHSDFSLCINWASVMSTGLLQRAWVKSHFPANYKEIYMTPFSTETNLLGWATVFLC